MRSKSLTALIFLMMLATLSLAMLHIEPAFAPYYGPTLLVDDTINRINATRTVTSGTYMILQLVIINVGPTDLTNLLLGIYFINGPDGTLQPTDFSFATSPDGMLWTLGDLNDLNVADPATQMQVELVIGKDGGETVASGELRNIFVNITVKTGIFPISGSDKTIQTMAIWMFNDANSNRHFDSDEVIYSEPLSNHGVSPDWDEPIHINVHLLKVIRPHNPTYDPRMDVNGDGKVDIRDLTIICWSFGSTQLDPRWNPNADIVQDGKIDIRDISSCAKYYGTAV